MKRLLALILVLTSVAASALAGDFIYIANPNPDDRLHLRAEPYEGAKSLGKYYNGAPIERTGFFNQNGWVEVQIGLGGGVRKGYMMTRYLSHEKQESAMPQYVAVAPVKAYQQPDKSSKSLTIAGGRLVSLMGFSDEWKHVLVSTGESEGNYTCFVPTSIDGLIPLSDNIPVYISNPDPADRLHLRAAPDANAQSMGKYYNGCAGTLLGFTEDGEWLKVELYGRTGYMMSRFVTVEGKTNRTYYGIPTARTHTAAMLYHNASLMGQSQVIPSGTEIEILGVINDKLLHVRIGDRIGYIDWTATDFIDPR